MQRWLVIILWFVVAVQGVTLLAADGNRLSYLDASCDPYYVGRNFPKLTTPQWVGDDGIEAVVVLAIDDMRDTAKYEAYLRPILQRLKQIDGRAPVSIMTCNIDPADPQLKAWLDEGLSIEVHTVDHPCPLLKGGDFDKAKSTYDRCVDLLNEIPGNQPVAFRMPCCDSRNTPSPRFWTEIFNQRSAKDNFLQIDTSVFNITTPNDEDLPRELVLDPDGAERFRKYLPFPSFVNTIEDYPYPYVIGGSCWEFPCVVPSDWEAQNLQQPNNPRTVADMKAALDAVVIKRGTFNLVFHPHGWIRNDQVVELIDHAVTKHGRKVKFLTFREAIQRINTNLLQGQPLRRTDGGDNGIRLLDLNNDGHMDVVQGSEDRLRSLVWQPAEQTWQTTSFPYTLNQPEKHSPQFGVIRSDGYASVHVANFSWQFTATGWKSVGGQLALGQSAREWSRLRDLDGDGICERISSAAVLRWNDTPADDNSLVGKWVKTDVRLPEDLDRPRHSVRFLDVNQDRRLDVLFSGSQRYALHLYKDLEQGWLPTSVAGQHGDGKSPALPRFYRPDETNHGVWAHSRHLWTQNEDTDRLPDGVDRVSFEQLAAHTAGAESVRDASGYEPPRSPEEAIATMRTTSTEELVVELVAAEPMITDPVAFDWGPDGRLWVVEMRDYPNGINWHAKGDPVGKPGGRVKVLTDDDGDGRYDSADVFLDDVPFPTGIKVWRDGILITAVPDIIFAADTDGDNVADRRETLYHGFAEGNQQHRANGLRWGLDNWLHVGNGDSGGTIQSLKTKQTLAISGRDLRIQPDTGTMQTESGQTQFGRNRDDWGNWFGGNNSNPMWHYVLDDHYLRRNPRFAPPGLRKQVSIQPGASPVFPTSLTVARFNDFDRANRFTSACSPIIYRDTLIGALGQTWSFVCEPVHNLVHREVVTRDGTSYTSRRPPGEEESEFLSSSDNWFRPTMVRTGPDGAIWIADMYRLVIEHPKWIPEDWQQRLDLRAGSDRGRIYRVRRADRRLRSVPRIDSMTTSELVTALDTFNGTRRDLVHQMLIWKNDEQAIPALRALLKSSDKPQVRVQALCAIDGLSGLDDELLLWASKDDHFAVRRHAVRLAESRLSESEPLAHRLLELVRDTDAQVRLQVAYSIGALGSSESGGELATMAAATNDPYLLAALHSSLHEKNVVEAVTSSLANGTPSTAWLDPLLATAGSIDNPEFLQASLVPLLKSAESGYESWHFTTVSTLLETFENREAKLDRTFGKYAADRLLAMAKAAQKLAVDPKAEEDLRRSCIRFLGSLPVGPSRTLLAELLAPQHGTSIQIAAARALVASVSPNDDTTALLLQGWPSHTPVLRAEVLDLLLSRPQWSKALLDAIENKHVQASHLNARRRQQLTRHKDPSLRGRAVKLLAVNEINNRQQLISDYAVVKMLDADATRGKQLFTKHCATCHRWQDQGHAIGPDLAALTDRSVGAMLVAVLDPNRAVEAKFLEYVAITQSGLQHTGMIRSETANSIVLVGPDEKSTSILRADLDEFRTVGKSLMPEGMEKELKPQDLADVLLYLQGPPVPQKQFPGNEPQVSPMRDDGSIRLLAMHARIYGPNLVFEQKYRNLGWWSSPQDHAVWQVRVAEAGKYRVTMDYACDNGAAGDQFVLRVAAQALRGVVQGTGTWDNYRSASLGTFSLPAGLHEVTMRSDGAISSAMIDLRSIRLSPQ
ncbi:MAG TPA: PVC-type heme-binding CxxCH protein [Pirellulaceae bacterium]|nr:PVC-type heme-binding CxxCH protein [Pirellulaceae bacterium]